MRPSARHLKVRRLVRNATIAHIIQDLHYQLNLKSRVAHRIYVRMLKFECHKIRLELFTLNQGVCGNSHNLVEGTGEEGKVGDRVVAY